jgi:hypothetical protein
MFNSSALWISYQTARLSATLLPMGRNINLDEHDRAKFKELLDELDWNQTKLAREAAVERHWVNQILLGRRGKRANSDLTEKVATALVGAVRGSTSFTPERKQFFMTFLGRFSAAAPLPPRMYMPGGPVPLDAVHYISRPEDEIFITNALQQDAFGALLTGPVQCGKSSLLWRLAEKATDLGIETIRVDPISDIPALWESGQSVAEMGASVATTLAKILVREWRLEPASFEVDGLDRLTPWLMMALETAPKKVRLLIIDDLSELGPLIMLFLRTFVRPLCAQRKIGIAIGSTTHFDDHFIARWTQVSTVFPWAPRSELCWLTMDDVQHLASFYQVKPQLCERLYRLTQGQPYLTHSALADQSFLGALDAWVRSPTEENARPIRGAKTYHRYVHSVRRSLLNASGLSAARRSEYLICLSELASAGKKHPSPSLPPELAEFLRKSFLISKESHEPTILLHKLVFEDLVSNQ